MPQNTALSKTVDEYLVRFSELPNLTLAKLIYKENPEIANNIDSIRSAIRYRMGVMGDKLRETAHITEFEPAKNANKLGIPNPFLLPESDEVEWEPYILPKKKRYGLLSDIHIPYHNIASLNAAIEKMLQKDVDAIFFNGDTVDFYKLSKYEQDPRKRSFKEELDMTKQFFDSLKKIFDIPFYFKIGNHEERYEAMLKIKAPEFLGIEEFRLENLLKFGEKGIELIEDKRVVKAGKLNILHGHEFGRSVFSPVNPARGYYMRSKTNTICGHNHQTSEHTEPNLNGDIVSVWSTGCLCELHPQYMPINRWNHGFAIIGLEEDGSFNVENYRINKGKIL